MHEIVDHACKYQSCLQKCCMQAFVNHACDYVDKNVKAMKLNAMHRFNGNCMVMTCTCKGVHMLTCVTLRWWPIYLSVSLHETVEHTSSCNPHMHIWTTHMLRKPCMEQVLHM